MNIKYTYVHNITDIDDKIINKAHQLGVSEETVSSEYEGKYLEILDHLNVIKPTFLPKVSDHIEEIQKIIQQLMDGNYAQREGEDIIFNVEKIREYGELSKQKLDQLKNFSNFCLWKITKKGKT